MQREDVERWTATLAHVGEYPLTAEVVLASDYAALLDRAERAETEVAALIHDIGRAKEQHTHLLAERDAALKEQERLARAWEAKHDAMVQQAKDHEDYFDKTQRRMAELVAERDAAFAAGQEEMRRRAVAATVSVETDHPSWVNAGSWACASELCGIRINDLPIKPRP